MQILSEKEGENSIFVPSFSNSDPIRGSAIQYHHFTCRGGTFLFFCCAGETADSRLLLQLHLSERIWKTIESEKSSVEHRVYTVGCQAFRPFVGIGSPTPSAASKCCFPHPGSRGGDTLACGGRPNSDTIIPLRCPVIGLKFRIFWNFNGKTISFYFLLNFLAYAFKGLKNEESV